MCGFNMPSITESSDQLFVYLIITPSCLHVVWSSDLLLISYDCFVQLLKIEGSISGEKS